MPPPAARRHARRFGQALSTSSTAHWAGARARAFFEPPRASSVRWNCPHRCRLRKPLLFAAAALLPELEVISRCARPRAGTGARLPSRAASRHRPEARLRRRARRWAHAAPPARDARPHRLPAAVHTIGIARAAGVGAVGVERRFVPEQPEADGDLLLERLRIRLGKDAVYGIATAADHRPENAWRPCQEQGRAIATANRHRPLWLLPRPLPCHDGRLKLKTGPERIESGWWDGGDVARDYYVAEDRNGAQLWVYCDRVSGEWYVHGVFA
jgi:protein ImuB